MKVRITANPMDAVNIAQISDTKERDLVAEVSAREGTFTITVCNGEKLLGYAVCGKDQGDVLAVYAARSFVPVLGPKIMKSFLGAAQVSGTPIRVHTEKVQAMARAMGAGVAMEGIDAEGIPHGVFL